MSLSEYIKAIGQPAAAALFGVKPGTVKSWQHGYRRPTTEKARQIIEVTGGKVGWNDIYPDNNKNASH